MLVLEGVSAVQSTIKGEDPINLKRPVIDRSFLGSSQLRVFSPHHKTQKKADIKSTFFLAGTPKGIRTPVTAVKRRCPRPD